MRRAKWSPGFSLAEVLLATATIAVSLLTLTLVLIQLMKASRKTVDVSAAELASEKIIGQLIYNAQYNAAEHPVFWNSDYPGAAPHYKSGTLTSNGTDFAYQMDAVTVNNDNTGGTTPVGGTGNNRLKRILLTVTWWDGANGNRAGYGKLKLQKVRLIHEEQ
ncbi:MAG: hypothetical protein U0931_14500 [Vulcanimicrobiota bacterium]